MAPATPPSAEAGRTKPAGLQIGFSSLMRAVRRYSLLVFIFALIAATAGTLVYFFLPLPKMTGRLVFLIKTQPEYVLNQNVWNDRDSGNFRQLQMATMTSPWVLNEALNQPGVALLPMFEQDKSVDPLEYLRSHLKIDFSLGTELMRVSLEGNSAEELLLMLKAVDVAYNKHVVQEENKRRRIRMDTLSRLQTQYSDRVKNIKSQIRNILAATGTSDPLTESIKERFLNSSIGQSDNELGRLRTLERKLTMELKVIEEEMKLPVALRPGVKPEIVESYVENDPALRKMRVELDGIMGTLQSYGNIVKPEAKTSRQTDLEQRKVDLEIKIKDLTAQLRAYYAGKLKEVFAKGAQDFHDNVKNQLDNVREQQQQVQKELKEIVKQLNDLKTQGAAADDLKVELNNNEAQTTRINNDLLTIQTEMDAPTRVVQWEGAHVVPGIEGNRRVKYTAMAVVGFLLLGLGLAQWLEIRHRRIQHIDEVTHGLGLHVLGTVPAMPKGGVAANSNWPHLLTEAVNTTRTMLLSGPHAATTKTLLVTSAMSGEGKTSLTTHLAVSLASAGRRVLLIDADMRRPAVHKVLGLTSRPGLGELLTGTAKLEDVTQATKIAGLHLVAAGTWSREAGASLSTERWSNMLREAAVGYDFVLVDSPPILPVADALAIARNVDGVLISVMQDLSRYGAVQTACQRLTMVGAKVLGVVVSGVKTGGGYYYYYYDERYSKAPAATTAAPLTPAAPTA